MLTTCASRTEHGRPYLGRGLTARAACLGALLTQRPRMDACFWTSRLRGACHRSLSCVLCCVVGLGWEGRRSVRDACACELEQERARTLHPIKSHRVRFLATPNFQRFKRQPIFSNF